MIKTSTVDLPVPDEASLAHSQRVAQRVVEAMDADGGTLPFSRYMELVLYAPGLGYYSAGARKLGPGGDFVTAPEVSSLFSACVASQVAEVLGHLGGGDVVEVGAGTGRMAGDMLAELARRDALPESYRILEVSADLRDRQREHLAHTVPDMLERVAWMDAWPAEGVRGVIVANEVLDALPVERIVMDGSPRRLGVRREGDGFGWATLPLTPALDAALEGLADHGPTAWPAGYVTELRTMDAAWLRSAAGALREGVLLLMDYGAGRREFYAPERRDGTLLCHFRHRAHGDPFVYPGLCDITAWVDFTGVAEAATDAGLDLEGHTHQAGFLIAAGLDEAAGRRLVDADVKARARIANEVRRLTLPGEMGERFRVMGFSRGYRPLLSGFAGADLCHLL